MTQTYPARCAGCSKAIDPLYDTPSTDPGGRTWHPTCLVAARGAQDKRDAGAGPLIACALITVVVPIVGVIAGIIYLFRNKIGPGLGLIAEGVLMILLYLALLA